MASNNNQLESDLIKQEIDDTLGQWLAKHDIPEPILGQLSWFTYELYRWNTRINLVGSKNISAILAYHVLDSLVAEFSINGSKIIDIGTGPGLPGLPLAILNPNRDYLLIDGSNRRLSFAQHVVMHLELKNIRIKKCRTEELKETGFDTAIARAYAPPEKALAGMLPLVSSNGLVILMQSKFPALSFSGTKVETRIVQVPGVKTKRCLWLYKKIKQCR